MNKKYFSLWQKEIIFSYKYGFLTRGSAIHIFLKEGYIPFISKHGYIFSIDKETVENTIASILYLHSINRINSFYLTKNNEYDDF